MRVKRDASEDPLKPWEEISIVPDGGDSVLHLKVRASPKSTRLRAWNPFTRQWYEVVLEPIKQFKPIK